jgi:hypothetical protein
MIEHLPSTCGKHTSNSPYLLTEVITGSLTGWLGSSLRLSPAPNTLASCDKLPTTDLHPQPDAGDAAPASA